MIQAAKEQWEGMPPFGKARIALALAAWLAIIGARLIAMPAMDAAAVNQEKIQKVDADLASGRAMAAEAAALRAAPKSTRESAMARLGSAATAQGSSASLRSGNGSAIFAVSKMPPESLAALLSQARQAGAPAEQAELSKSPEGLWSGTITLRLPKENP